MTTEEKLVKIAENREKLYKAGMDVYGEPFAQMTDWTWFASYDARAVIVPLLGMLDTSSGIDFSCMFQENTLITEVPLFNTCNGEYFESMFEGCSALRKIPSFNVEKGTTFSHMFDGCSSLEAIPLLDTSGGKSVSYMFANCDSLTTIPQLNFSNATNAERLFTNCTCLVSLPHIDCRSATSVGGIFSSCINLQSIKSFNMSSVVKASNLMFYNCVALKDIEIVGEIKLNINFGDSPLSKASIESVVSALSQTVTGKTVTFKATAKQAAFSDEEWEALIATRSNWTVTLA